MAEVPHQGTSGIHFPRTFRAFEHRDYRLLWSGNFLTLTCRWMQIIIASWLILELTDSPWLAGLVGFFAWGPMIPLGLLGGVLADVADRKKIIVCVLFANFVACSLFTAVLLFGVVKVWHVYSVLTVSGIGWALDMPSKRYIVLDMLGSLGVTNGLALDSLAMSFSIMVGPALAGLLIDFVDVTGSFVVMSVLYLIAILLLSGLHVQQKSIRLETRSKILGGALESIGYVLKHPILRVLLVITIVMNVLLFTYMPLVPVMARDVLNVGPTLLGLLSGSAGLGSMVGNLILASRANVRHHALLVLTGAMVAMLGLFIFAISGWYVMSLVALLTLGLGVSTFGPGQFTLYMLLSTGKMRGKVLGVVSLAIGTNPLGSLLLAALVGLLSPSIALGLSSSIGFLILVFIAVTVPALKMPTESLRAKME